jgi:hypothetical protein
MLDLVGAPSLRDRRLIDEIGGALVVIHAQHVDPSVAQPGAVHISADRAATVTRAANATPSNPREAA